MCATTYRPGDLERRAKAECDRLMAMLETPSGKQLLWEWWQQQQTVPDSFRGTDVCIYLGNGKLLVDRQGITVEGAEETVLEALIELRQCKMPELVAKSGYKKAARILKRIVEKHHALNRFITLPGKRGKGGYSTTIIASH